MKKRVLFYCQSLLGIGHFIRSRELLSALRDFDVCFVYGGEVVQGFELPSGVEVVYLPALKSDEAFSALHVVDPALSLEDVQEQRKKLLLTTFDRFAPDALIIELFPFGRKHLSFELLPLLTQARAQNPALKVACSLRDILVSRPDQARYEARVCTLMNQYFDLLLIHADPQWQRLEETFASVSEIRCAVAYTGYVARQSPHRRDNQQVKDRQEPALLVVSIGGGRVGHELIDCAIEAAALLSSPYRMHIVTGPHIPAEQLQRLQQRVLAHPHITVQHYATDFLSWLQRADVSISLAGYNTCMDILSAGVRALVYPFTGQNNDEQTRRARKLSEAGLIGMLEPESLSPALLASRIEQALTQPCVTSSQSIDLQGAERTAQLLTELLRGDSPRAQAG